MTKSRRVVYINIEHEGKPIVASVVRHCQDMLCMMNRFDMVNYYKLTNSSYKRLQVVIGKYAFGKNLIVKEVFHFRKNDDK